MAPQVPKAGQKLVLCPIGIAVAFSGAMVRDVLFAVEGKNGAGELYFVCLITYA